MPETIKVSYNHNMVTTEDHRCPIVVTKEGDMFEYAREEYHKGKRVGLHNFANNYSPGLMYIDSHGNHKFYTNTQEEQLLSSCLINGKVVLPLELYPICLEYSSINALLTTDVKFDTGYTADIITCPALDNPQLTSSKKYNSRDREIMLKRMILIINTAQANDVLITGLWGCGIFNNPVNEVMKLWREAIKLSTVGPKEIMFLNINDKKILDLDKDIDTGSDSDSEFYSDTDPDIEID